MTNESRTIHIFVYNQKVKSSEFKRWLEKQGRDVYAWKRLTLQSFA
jgi:hypothetical protein